LQLASVLFLWLVLWLKKEVRVLKEKVEKELSTLNEGGSKIEKEEVNKNGKLLTEEEKNIKKVVLSEEEKSITQKKLDSLIS
jgi:hypothetical protein